jgi:hypothetical protein
LRNYYGSKRQLLKLALKAGEKRQRLGDAKQALSLMRLTLIAKRVHHPIAHANPTKILTIY